METITPFKTIIEQELQRLQSFSAVPYVHHAHMQYDFHQKRRTVRSIITSTITTVSHFLFQ